LYKKQVPRHTRTGTGGKKITGATPHLSVKKKYLKTHGGINHHD